MPVTASYQSCFFDVFSQRKQKKSRPSTERRDMGAGARPTLYDLCSKYRSGVYVFFTQKSRGGKCPSRRVIKVVSLTCFRSGNKKTRPSKERRDMGAGARPTLYDLCSKYRSGVYIFFTQKSRGGKCPSRRVTGAANRA